MNIINLYRKISILLLMILGGFAYTQDYSLSNLSQQKKGSFPVQSKGQLWFISDILQYQGKENRTRIDVLYSVNLSKYWQESQLSDSLLLLHIDCRIFDKNGDLLSETTKNKRFTPSSKDTMQTSTYIDIIQYSLLPGLYEIKITMQDSMHNNINGITEHSLKIRDFSKQFSLSDIYFIADIQEMNNHVPEKKNSFEKNGYLFIPNVQRSYLNTDNEQLYIYYEINNLDFDSEGKSFYHTYYSIMDMEDTEVRSGSKEWLIATASGLARIEGISVSDLPSGIYKIRVKTVDVKDDTFASINSYFLITAPAQQYASILPMTETDIKKYIKQMCYIATDKEIEIFKQLDKEAKQNFLLDFWESKDPDPTTKENEFMQEHFKRLAYAEANFRGGIESDMGRIYIIYGPPQDIDRDYSNMRNSKQFITWYYALEGKVKFVFADRTGDGIYTLVHSTKFDEYSDPDWKEHIMRNK
ncbi:MAG: GWxTD domain-containing protein [bacterium]